MASVPPGRATLSCALPKAEDIVDRIKARSTLVSLIQPVAWVTQLASHPIETGSTLVTIGRHLGAGELGSAGSDLGGLINGAMQPTGVANAIYRGGLFLQAGVDALVGGVELYQGAERKSSALKLMGAIDLMGSASSAAFAVGHGPLALGLNLVSNTARAILVLSRPHEYSRIQKAKTLFDSLASVSCGLMKAGIAPVPSLAGYIGFGVTQILYMNNEAIRKKIDALVDWILG